MILALDTETTGGDFFHGSRPYLVTSCDDAGTVRYWEWPVDPRTRRPDVPAADVYEIRDLIDSADQIVGQNLKFDVHALKTIGLLFDAADWAKVDDTLIAGHLLNSATPHDLTRMAVQYLDEDISGYETALEKACKSARDWARRNRPAWRIAKEKQADMPSAKEQTWKIDAWLPRVAAAEQGLPPEHGWWTVTAAYANADSGVTLKLWHAMQRELKRRGLTNIYRERMRLVPVIWRMEDRGVTVHEGRLNHLRDEYKADQQEMIRTLVAMAEAEGHHLTVPKAGNNQSLLDLCFGWAEVRCDVCRGAVRIRRADVARQKEFETARTPCQRCRRAGTAKVGYPKVYEYPLLDLPVTVRTDTGAPSLGKEARAVWLDELPDGPTRNFVAALSAKSKRDTSINYLNAYERFMIPLGGGLRAVAAAPAVNGKPSAGVGTAPARRAAVFGAPAVNTAGPVLARAEPGNPWHVLHPNLNQTGTDTLRMSSNNPNCVDAETEFLTQRGWVRADQLVPVDKVAQYWKEDETIDLIKPSRLVKERYRGPMHRIKTEQQIDLLVTPNHRCLVKKRTGEFTELAARDFKDDYLYPHSGRYAGGDLHLTPDEITWLCAVQADGYYTKVGGREYGVSLSFKKERKISRLRECLDRLSAAYRVSTYEDVTTFYVGMADRLVGLAKSLMPEKRFGPWVMDLDRDALDAFTQEVFHWDGGFTRQNSYSSSIKENCDWVQIAWTLTGGRTRLQSKHPQTGWATNEHHYLNVVQGRNYSMTTNHTNETVPWDNWVYCVTVPSSYVVVRRNGKVSVTGNSQNVDKHPDNRGFSLRRVFGPAPGREWWPIDYENIELRIPAFEAGEKELMDVFLRPDDAPYYGSYHLVIFELLHPDKFRKFGKRCKDEFASTWYQWVKNGNFAVLYGAMERKADLTYRVPGAYRLIRGRFPKMAALADRMVARANRTGGVETIPDRNVDPLRGYPIVCARGQRGEISPTVPFNYHIQSTAMWCTARAMVRTDEQCQQWRAAGFDAWLALQVHDEIVFDLPAGGRKNLPRVNRLVALMEQSGEDIGVPLKAAAKYCPNNWAAAEELAA